MRIETFRGSRSHYRDWKRIIEAQRNLYKLEDAELAMLIYLSCQGEPRQILNQLEVSEMQEPGGLGRIMRLLEESFGARAEERFEQKQEEYLAYRRAPGQSIAAYISTLKRLRGEYLKETTISDKSFAQRLLSRAALTRRERMDIFFSSGGKYNSSKIEQVMRFRCSNLHTEEKKTSTGDRSSYRILDEKGRTPIPRKKQFQPRRGGDRKPYRSSQHSSHLAEPVEPNTQDEPYSYEEEEDDADEEDLEQEALWQEEEQDDEGHFSVEEDEEEDLADVDDLKEAYASGWRAKQKSADQRKARGYHSSKRPRIHASWIVQAMTAAAASGPDNEWVSRQELETLKKLTGLPLSAARIHRKPRKRLMRPPRAISRPRLSILIGEDPRTLSWWTKTRGRWQPCPRGRWLSTGRG